MFKTNPKLTKLNFSDPIVTEKNQIQLYSKSSQLITES